MHPFYFSLVFGCFFSRPNLLPFTNHTHIYIQPITNKEDQNRKKRESRKRKKSNHLLVTSTIPSINGVKIRWNRLLCVKWWNVRLSWLIYCGSTMYSHWWCDLCPADFWIIYPLHEMQSIWMCFFIFLSCQRIILRKCSGIFRFLDRISASTHHFSGTCPNFKLKFSSSIIDTLVFLKKERQIILQRSI